jgi:tellurite resistance protein
MGWQVMGGANVGTERLARAVRSVIDRQTDARQHCLPTLEHFRQGADATRASSNDAPARYFQSILELGYLVASADGFAEQEAHALAALLEQATGAVVKRDELELHFKDLEDGCAMLGRRMRLRRAAADFEDAIGKAEAIGFATLVAAADGVLADAEMDSLSELGSCFALSRAEVENIVNGITRDIQLALEN